MPTNTLVVHARLADLLFNTGSEYVRNSGISSLAVAEMRYGLLHPCGRYGQRQDCMLRRPHVFGVGLRAPGTGRRDARADTNADQPIEREHS